MSGKVSNPSMLTEITKSEILVKISVVVILHILQILVKLVTCTKYYYILLLLLLLLL